MKCYRCNNELSDNDEVCSKCGSKVIKLNKKKNVVNKDYKEDYYRFSISCIITKFFSFILAFIAPTMLYIPWIIMSLIFSLVGLFKYKDKRNIKLIIIDAILLFLEVFIIIFILKKIHF